MLNTHASQDLSHSAVLDSAHVGDIHGALGTISRHDTGRRTSWGARWRTLLAILGPGLIVMVGDNDAGAFSTYTQAGQNYGTALLWTLTLLIPVLYVNQEMVLRLGTVTGVGHARLILERFGKFWGAFSVIDLFILNALTIVTEFIGISLGLDHLGIPRYWGVAISALMIILAASTGNFRRFERFSLMLVLGSLLLVPVLVMVHPPMHQVLHDMVVPGMPKGAPLSEVMLLIIAIVGTTVAPWQLFFQQSYVIDKRITPRFMTYEKIDLVVGIVLVIVGAIAMMGFSAATFAGRPEMGQFADAAAVAAGVAKYVGEVPATLFSIALIDASIIGAAAVSLSTAYAIGDVFAINHSLHRKPSDAKTFYGVYVLLIVAAAALVLIPDSPLGLITNAVQTLAGILLPGASVFLLLLCNDKAVLGPWVNGRLTNIFTGIVVAVLVLLSIILTASVLYPSISSAQILGILVGGMALTAVVALGLFAVRRLRGAPQAEPIHREGREHWRMPPLHTLPSAQMSVRRRLWLGVLRAYLAAALIMAIVKVVQMIVAKH
ncbi:MULTISPECIES: NRAMP family divalent metal transporter [unclassified Dyella]|uniref:NRAMP family divalent metal transporter n=1 Tax=unclassified Dyella TaxID=2634549 RepID=UPI000C8280CE|nr:MULTISPECIES: NRAMP family divalent metal transporter [unclassified Dyella]MDR3445883.1 divalent metal cation transporter [Dyella sp.]PMQ02824.1 Divalent metal cation transporter MntH [Dyella sp. AD56]